MPYLLKSRAAAVHFPACIQAAFDLLFGDGGNSNAKLKAHAVNLLHHIVANCPVVRLAQLGPIILQALTR